MRPRCATSVRTLVGTLLAWLAGCPATSDSSGDATSSGGQADTTGTTTGTSSSGVTTEGSSTTGPVGDGVLQCVETCTVPSDCCIPGEPCPGPYPYNVDCIDDLCVPPRCVDDEDCAAILPDAVCRAVGSRDDCVLPCTDDGPCTAAALGTCAGVDDDGGSFCMVRCDDPGMFCGNQTCDAANGLCTCTGDGQCQSDWRCID